jgi:hypothetical protein
MLGSALSRRALAAALFASLALSSAAVAVAGDDAPAPAAEGQGVQFLPGSPSLVEILAKAAELNKPAFLDFGTDT